MVPVGNAKGRYNKYATDRNQYLERARECAKLTIPTLVPPDNNSSSTKYPTPYQSIGARGVNNLASKLLIAILPPNSPFFRFMIDDFTLEELSEKKGVRAAVEKALGSMERAIQSEIEGSPARVKIFEALKQLLVAGNVIIHYPKQGLPRIHKLPNFVVKRAPDGMVLEMIIMEATTPLALSEEVRIACGVETNDSSGNPKPVEIYTVIYRDGKRWKVYQEINKKLVPNSDGDYPEDKLPWIPLRMIAVDNEDYGRSYVEEYLGDLISLEGLSQAITDGSVAASKVLFFVMPNGVTKKDDVAKAPNGAVRTGNANDVTTLQLNKFADFRVAADQIAVISERLAYAFLLNTAVQRKGERVTAEEIRYMAGELEDALGGVYSVLSQELQLPYVKLIYHRLERQGKLPKIPADTVKPTITTGLEALGRGHDLNKLNILSESVARLGSDVVKKYLNVSDYITRTATALGIDADGLVNSEESVKQQEQMEQMMQMLQQNAPQLLQQFQQAQGMNNGNIEKQS